MLRLELPRVVNGKADDRMTRCIKQHHIDDVKRIIAEEEMVSEL